MDFHENLLAVFQLHEYLQIVSLIEFSLINLRILY